MTKTYTIQHLHRVIVDAVGDTMWECGYQIYENGKLLVDRQPLLPPPVDHAGFSNYHIMQDLWDLLFPESQEDYDYDIDYASDVLSEIIRGTVTLVIKPSIEVKD